MGGGRRRRSAAMAMEGEVEGGGRRRVVRIIFRDEDATDSSSSEEEGEGEVVAARRVVVKRTRLRCQEVERRFTSVRQLAARRRQPMADEACWPVAAVVAAKVEEGASVSASELNLQIY